MTEQQTLREADNIVTIEGTLLEIRSNEWDNKEGISIELDIEVAENEVHTVHGMARYKKKEDGSENKIAKSFKTIINEFKTVSEHGREEADKVRITQGRIGLNEFYDDSGVLRSYPQISTNFINRIKNKEEFNPKAEFEVEIFVKSVVPEVKNEEETGRVKINALIPLYGGRVIPFEFVVTPEGSDFVEQYYEPGVTTKVFGDIINFKEVKTTEIPVAFGKPKKKVTTKTVREFLITGGTDPYDEDDKRSFDPELMKKALAEREVYLEELKNNKSNKKQSKKHSTGGFGKKPSKSSFSADDLPF